MEYIFVTWTTRLSKWWGSLPYLPEQFVHLIVLRVQLHAARQLLASFLIVLEEMDTEFRSTADHKKAVVPECTKFYSQTNKQIAKMLWFPKGKMHL